jgi:hypothetical protein
MMASITPEPEIIKHENPEQTLQHSLILEIRSLFNQSKADYFLIEGFGLDIAIFTKRNEVSYSRFLELKAFVGNRPGGVGIGTSKGRGAQIDLLLLPASELQLADAFMRWVLVDGTLPKGSPRYAYFTCTQASKAVMGKVARGKQNNLRVSYFQKHLITWDQLSDELLHFLLV